MTSHHRHFGIASGSALREQLIRSTRDAKQDARIIRFPYQGASSLPGPGDSSSSRWTPFLRNQAIRAAFKRHEIHQAFIDVGAMIFWIGYIVLWSLVGGALIFFACLGLIDLIGFQF